MPCSYSKSSARLLFPGLISCRLAPPSNTLAIRERNSPFTLRLGPTSIATVPSCRLSMARARFDSSLRFNDCWTEPVSLGTACLSCINPALETSATPARNALSFRSSLKAFSCLIMSVLLNWVLTVIITFRRLFF